MLQDCPLLHLFETTSMNGLMGDDAAVVRHAAVRYRTVALNHEQSARQRLVRLRRELSAERVAHARWSVEEQKQMIAEQLREEKDRVFNRAPPLPPSR